MFVLAMMSAAERPASSQSRNSSAENGGLASLTMATREAVEGRNLADSVLRRHGRRPPGLVAVGGPGAALGGLEVREEHFHTSTVYASGRAKKHKICRFFGFSFFSPYFAKPAFIFFQ